jgi:hypothetical protein
MLNNHWRAEENKLEIHSIHQEVVWPAPLQKQGYCDISAPAYPVSADSGRTVQPFIQPLPD